MSLLHDSSCAIGLPTAADRLRRKRWLVAQQRCRWSRVAAGVAAAIGVLLALPAIDDDGSGADAPWSAATFVGPIDVAIDDVREAMPAAPWSEAMAHLSQPSYSIAPKSILAGASPDPIFSESRAERAIEAASFAALAPVRPMIARMHERLVASTIDQFIRRASSTLIQPIVQRFAWTQIIDPTFRASVDWTSGPDSAAVSPQRSTSLEPDPKLRGFHLPWEFW